MEIEPITFDKDATDETNSISKANKNLWESAGVSQIMDNSKLTGSTAVTAAMRFDALFIQNHFCGRLKRELICSWIMYSRTMECA